MRTITLRADFNSLKFEDMMKVTTALASLGELASLGLIALGEEEPAAIEEDTETTVSLLPPPAAPENTPAKRRPPTTISDASIIRRLRNLKEPANAKMLGELLGLHHTTIRPRLQALEERGKVQSVDAPGKTGRPSRHWIATPVAATSGE